MTRTESAVSSKEWLCVVVSRSPQSVVEDMAYALSQLGRHYLIKEEQQRAIEAICVEMTFLSLCLLVLVEAYVFMSFLS